MPNVSGLLAERVVLLAAFLGGAGLRAFGARGATTAGFGGAARAGCDGAVPPPGGTVTINPGNCPLPDWAWAPMLEPSTVMMAISAVAA